MRMSRGILLVISGFAGTGKGTIVSELLDKYDNYALSVSATTRKPRPGEVDGVHYFFRTVDEFQEMIAKDALLEYAEYVGNFYGTPRGYVEQQLALGRDVILEIEMQGALKIKEKFPETLLLFVVPPSAETLKERLQGRGTESKEVIEKRLSRAVEETSYIRQYDYLVINDDLQTCVEELHGIIQSEHFRISRNETFIEKLETQLRKLDKSV